MFGLIKRNELNEIEVMWVKDSEILAVRNSKNQSLTYITAYGELNMPQTLEEAQAVLNSVSSDFIRADRDVIINSSKVVEHNIVNHTIKLDGSNLDIYVVSNKWNEIVK
ncbi:LytTr DNA-binding domain-containing protein [Paenibacillus sophorae]|uniref:LytTR family transcriptional regulator DNA-binding domain-containing protein n=1 Tax=Paenibacillus sophorae TaxID=1333845 RepID=A0A1H8GWS2_9BACL|nr:LytTR family transcriptional regulator DNA-binding domain-containing protein [Paenibacillus sophorae]QWU14361.1 LytTR family transcriptional regulator DNA-binding domain-containing protein [Paenibacillus sophorae]SEN48164.1 LytTr DNA-binding domain-containing protein [Paenibacillus sophorae]